MSVYRRFKRNIRSWRIDNVVCDGQTLVKRVINDTVSKYVIIYLLPIQEASNDRKMEMQEFDRTRQKNEELNELELEAQQQSEYLLQKANEQQDEQEDEVKKINEVRKI